MPITTITSYDVCPHDTSIDDGDLSTTPMHYRVGHTVHFRAWEGTSLLPWEEREGGRTRGDLEGTDDVGKDDSRLVRTSRRHRYTGGPRGRTVG